jgi:hypothetical protein
MNSHPKFQKTCLAAVLLAGCCAASAEPDILNPAVQVTVETQAPAMPAIQPAAAATASPAVQVPVVASDPAAAAAPVEGGGNPDVASGGETQAPALLDGEPETAEMNPLDAEDAAGADAAQEAPPAPAAAIDPGSLHGEWIVKEQHPDAGEVVTLFSINPDSTFAGTMTVAGNVVWSYSGNWYLDGNLITWFYTQSTPPLMLVDETEVDEIITVDSEKLVYRSGKRDVLETLYRANN